MIWFFLMGMIAGAVGMVMFAGWWIRGHVKRVTAEEMSDELRDIRAAESNNACCNERWEVPEPYQCDDPGHSSMGPASEQRMADQEHGESKGKS